MTEYANRSARNRSPADTEAGLRRLLDAPKERERRDAALALVDRSAEGLDDETVEALEERVERDESVDVRQFAVEALGVAGAGEPTLRDALDGDADEWVRAEAVVALSRVALGDVHRTTSDAAHQNPKDSEDAETLRAALDDDSGFVRRNAVIALGKTGAAGAETFADRIKNDPHPAVREYAATYLGETAEDIEEAVRLLAAVLARDPAAFVRAKAAGALGELGTDRAEQALESQGITDRSDDVRRAAKTALAAARGVDPDQLEVEIEEPSPPGGGPQTRAETPDGGPEQGRTEFRR